MSDYILTVPEEIYARAQKFAEETSQPVEQVLIDFLRTFPAPLGTLPADEEAELDLLKQLSDDTLWTIARERMAEDDQTRMQDLMDKNSLGTITPQEYTELEKLVEHGERSMVRKSEAGMLLTRRGYKVTPDNLAPNA